MPRSRGRDLAIDEALRLRAEDCSFDKRAGASGAADWAFMTAVARDTAGGAKCTIDARPHYGSRSRPRAVPDSALLLFLPYHDDLLSKRMKDMVTKCEEYIADIAKSTELVGPISNDILLLTKSNDPPPPSFITHERPDAQLKEIRLSISSISNLIAEFETGLEILRQRKEVLETKQTTLQLVLNPMRRIPTDVLAVIFQFCVDEDVRVLSEMRSTRPGQNTEDHYPGSLDTTRAPWSLGQVCRTWRSLVTSLPIFWTYIDVGWRTLPANVLQNSPNLDYLLSIQLQRCRGLPISVVYHHEDPIDATDPVLSLPLLQSTHIDSLLFLLCSRSSQWKKAEIVSDLSALRSLSSYQGYFESLEELDINFFSTESMPFDAFKSAPRLTRLILRGQYDANFLHDAHPHLLPWHQITHLEVKETSEWEPVYEDVLKLLEKSQNVQMGIFSIGSPSNPEMDTPIEPYLQLRALHTLVLKDLEGIPCPIGPLLDGILDAPALNSLTFSNGLGKTASSALIQLLERTSCGLEELTIGRWRGVVDESSDTDDDEEDDEEEDDAEEEEEMSLPDIADQVFSKDVLRHLVSLNIEAEGESSANDHELFLQSLRTSQFRPILLPKLRSLTLTGSGWERTSLLEMVTSRRSSHSMSPCSQALEQLVLVDVGVYESRNGQLQAQQVMDHLDHLAKDGLRFERRRAGNSTYR